MQAKLQDSNVFVKYSFMMTNYIIVAAAKQSYQKGHMLKL